MYLSVGSSWAEMHVRVAWLYFLRAPRSPYPGEDGMEKEGLLGKFAWLPLNRFAFWRLAILAMFRLEEVEEEVTAEVDVF